MTITQFLTKLLRRKNRNTYIPNARPLGAATYNWQDVRWERQS